MLAKIDDIKAIEAFRDMELSNDLAKQAEILTLEEYGDCHQGHDLNGLGLEGFAPRRRTGC